MQKINVAVLAGGRSSEHDISRLSAMSIIDALDPAKYEAVAVLIERSGDWRVTSRDKLALPEGSPQADPLGVHHERTKRAALEAGTGSAPMRVRAETRPATVVSPSSAIRGVDVIFPVLHGPYGEDGTMQGLLETAGVPYVGAGVLASAVGMDKAVFKAVLRDAGVPVAPGTVIHARDTDPAGAVHAVAAEHGWPIFIKPARLGSSIGISRVTGPDEVDEAVRLALSHDRKAVVEAAIDGIEVECGVLGNEEPLISVPGEVELATDADWYDFETKYEQGRMSLIVPARISDSAAGRVQDIARRVFEAIECTGLARIDCFVTPDEQVIVNEVNTMPGFTATSAYAKLFEASGYSYNQIVDQLIQLAIERHRTQAELRH